MLPKHSSGIGILKRRNRKKRRGDGSHTSTEPGKADSEITD